MHTAEKQNILIVGDGAREHALGWKAQQSPLVNHIYFAPGNPGTESIGTNISRGAEDIDDLVSFSADSNIDLAIIGPEKPLTKGIVNSFNEAGLLALGPTKETAKLESSKTWATEFMENHGIPHAKSRSFTDLAEAVNFIWSNPYKDPPVIKTDGLASGKGVVIPETIKDAVKAASSMLVNNPYDDNSGTVVVQERLHGYEVSAIGISDGKRILPFLLSQDHKRLLDNNEGPNTGGMGAIANLAHVDGKTQNAIYKDILGATIRGMEKDGTPFKGILFAGVMVTREGPKVLEFNCRFGDPETQALMLLLQSDLVKVGLEAARGNLTNGSLRFSTETAIATVLAAEGYPTLPITGDSIYGLPLPQASDVMVFQAGTGKNEDGDLITTKGRALTIAARGFNAKEARKKVYNAIGENGVHFKDMQYRKDIGVFA